jgi:hypothetical protein
MPKLLVETNQPIAKAKGPSELLEEALKGLEDLQRPAGKAGVPWRQE